MFQIIPDAVQRQTLRFLEPGNSAREAAQMMTEFDISSVVVLDGGKLVGLLTERDLARRVVGANLPAETTVLSQIMTRDPQTISPDGSTLEALERMRLGKFRHLPIVDGGEVVGMVSMRDLRHAIARDSRRAASGSGLWQGVRKVFGGV